MGRTFHFECPVCQYRARLSGGFDSGLHCEVQTMVCRECRELFDALLKVRTRRRETLEIATRRLPAKEADIPPVVLRQGSFQPLEIAVAPLEWKQFKLACPTNPRHRVEEWKEPGRCPRCGNFMEKSGIPFRLWE